MRTIKMIWDFRGPAGQRTAEHHEIHLKEYLQAESIPYVLTGTVTLSEVHSLAFVVVTETFLRKIRDDLKPHRAELYVQ